jgi:hypothetical protein
MSCVPATNVHARVPPIHLGRQVHTSKCACPASKRAKWTLWLVAATKRVCALPAGRSCGRQR